MECLINSPAFNNVKMAWVAGVGVAEQWTRHTSSSLASSTVRSPRRFRTRGTTPVPEASWASEFSCGKGRLPTRAPVRPFVQPVVAWFSAHQDPTFAITSVDEVRTHA